MKKILALFPGQGSQKTGMGRDLFEKSEIARAAFAEADKALGFELSKICFEGPEEKLTATDIAQPAILTVSTICFRLLDRSQCTITAAAGHSLGEYSALVAAGAIQFVDAVRLVHMRGRFMQDAVPRGEGKMIAVLGKDTDFVEAAISQISSGVVQIANDNAPGQIVVAGAACAINDLVKVLDGVKTIELAVSAPFHCALMKKAEENLRGELEQLNITSPEFPVYSNYYARPLTDPEEIREALALQVCGRVRWVESMKQAITDTSPDCVVEFGHGAVLTGLMKRINPEFARLNLNSTEPLF